MTTSFNALVLVTSLIAADAFAIGRNNPLFPRLRARLGLPTNQAPAFRGGRAPMVARQGRQAGCQNCGQVCPSCGRVHGADSSVGQQGGIGSEGQGGIVQSPAGPQGNEEFQQTIPPAGGVSQHAQPPAGGTGTDAPVAAPVPETGSIEVNAAPVVVAEPELKVIECGTENSRPILVSVLGTEVAWKDNDRVAVQKFTDAMTKPGEAELSKMQTQWLSNHRILADSVTNRKQSFSGPNLAAMVSSVYAYATGGNKDEAQSDANFDKVAEACAREYGEELKREEAAKIAEAKKQEAAQQQAAQQQAAQQQAAQQQAAQQQAAQQQAAQQQAAQQQAAQQQAAQQQAAQQQTAQQQQPLDKVQKVQSASDIKRAIDNGKTPYIVVTFTRKSTCPACRILAGESRQGEVTLERGATTPGLAKNLAGTVAFYEADISSSDLNKEFQRRNGGRIPFSVIYAKNAAGNYVHDPQDKRFTVIGTGLKDTLFRSFLGR